MIDWRYHLVSLIAVFLALTLGIILGSAIMDKGVLVERQTALVKSIQRDLNSLRSENKELQSEVNTQQKFLNEALPWLIDKRLVGKRTGLIILSPNLFEEVGKMKNILEEAGGEVLVVQIFWPKKMPENTREKLKLLYPEENLSQENLKILFFKTLGELIVSFFLESSTQTAYLNTFINENLVKFSDRNLLPVSEVVLIGGDEGSISSLVEKMKGFGVKPIGVSSPKTTPSSIPIFQRLGLRVIDNIDSPFGLSALVFLLEGREGSFGSSYPRFLPEYKE